LFSKTRIDKNFKAFNFKDILFFGVPFHKFLKFDDPNGTKSFLFDQSGFASSTSSIPVIKGNKYRESSLESHSSRVIIRESSFEAKNVSLRNVNVRHPNIPSTQAASCSGERRSVSAKADSRDNLSWCPPFTLLSYLQGFIAFSPTYTKKCNEFVWLKLLLCM
jgi:hypothetical protein